MANNTDDDVRRLFTEIGCIMEDASVIALLWKAADGTDVSEKFWEISDAHAKIGELLLQIDRVARNTQ